MKPIGKKDFQALVNALMENNAKLATKIIQENPELVPRLVKEIGKPFVISYYTSIGRLIPKNRVRDKA